ncbi:FUSC family protein [Streptomyces olivaceiscleroticus]|uniref:Integral membrane bound transporter domain-containing protein n=1 Tax=Streptomyces olivaceiscleroticus TaxID=68245 RepID=A0ABP3K5W9_9ACTN
MPRAVPVWLAHPFRWQRLPVPWPAVVRGALCAGPLLGAGVATGHPAAGVLAGLGSMLAGVNDRPGTRRKGVLHIGLPALAVALGMFAGASLSGVGWWLVLALFGIGFVSGAGSVAGPVRSTAGMQMLAAAILGAGMPLPHLEPWQKSLLTLVGAGWLLLLRLVLRTPRPAGGSLSGERAAVATVFDALAEALTAVGTPGAEPARRRLTTALDRADEAMRLRRLLRRRPRADERRLIERFAAATALCEASVALLWEAQPLPARIADGPRALAAALRTGRPPGRLPAPETSTPARSAFDRALLDAAVVFARTLPPGGGAATGATDERLLHGLRPALGGPGATPEEAAGAAGDPTAHKGTGEPAASGGSGAPAASQGSGAWSSFGSRAAFDTGRWASVLRGVAGVFAWRRGPGRRVFGPAGRDYGLRVGLCIAACTATALFLRAEHWYWLPATATFLVKPDLGPLFSRTVNRFAGTACGVLVFALAGPALPGAWWPVVMATAGGALLPFATRHFALQTVAITLMVLSFVHVSGAPEAAPERIVDTAIACLIVVVVGHLPRLADPRRRVGPRVGAALRCTEAYLRQVLATAPGADTGERLALRRTAYQALGEARTAAEMAAAELLARRTGAPDWPTVVKAAERIVDATTAAAVRLDQGAQRPSEEDARRLCAVLTEMAGALDAPRRHRPRLLPPPSLESAPDCATLSDVAAELERMRGYAGAV